MDPPFLEGNPIYRKLILIFMSDLSNNKVLKPKDYDVITAYIGMK